MIPTTYPSNSDATRPSRMIGFTLLSNTGLVAWKDYIPIAVKTSPAASDRNTFNDSGYIGIYMLASNTGLTAWRDYVPCFVVTYVAGNQWRDSDVGFIPYVDETV